MKFLYLATLLATLSLFTHGSANGQNAKERITLAGQIAEFTPVEGKYLLFLTPGQAPAQATSKAARQASGLKVEGELHHMQVVRLPNEARPSTAAKAASMARSFSGQALRPVYTYSDGVEESPNGTILVRFRTKEAMKGLQSLAKSVGATWRTDALDATLAYLDLPAEANPFDVARSLQQNKKLLWAEPDMVKFLNRDNLTDKKAGDDAAITPISTAKAPLAPQAASALGALPNDPMLSTQWYLHNPGRGYNPDIFNHIENWNNSDVKAFEAWQTTQGSSSIKVAIIDEGVDLNHPDLQGQLLPGFDATGLNSSGAPRGDDAHGTACAGIVAAAANNGIGIAGVAPNCKIIPVRIAYGTYDGRWITNNSWIASSITWAWKYAGADVLSNSWGGGSNSSLINNAIDSAAMKGRGGLGSPVLFAAGNSNTSDVNWPSAYPTCIGVIAMSMCDTRKTMTSCDGEDFWGSNYGQNGDVAAPGVKMATLDISGSAGYSRTDYTATFNGTSSACPTAAGVVALMLSANPGLTQTQARALLEGTCDKVGGYTYMANVAGQPNGTFSQDLGYGRINALRLVNAAAAPTPDALVCGQTLRGATSAANYFNAYGISASTFPGKEKVYTIYASKGDRIKINMIPNAGQADLFVLKRYHKDSCLAFSANPGAQEDAVTFDAPTKGTYYVVVDGSANFTISMTCLGQFPTGVFASAPILTCGSSVTATSTDGQSNWQQYLGCSGNTYTANEQVYAIQGEVGMTISASFDKHTATGWPILFLLSGPDPGTCLATGNPYSIEGTLTYTLQNQMYYLVVDSYTASSYKLTLNCTSAPCHPTTNCTNGDYLTGVSLNTLNHAANTCNATGYSKYYPISGYTTNLTRKSTYTYQTVTAKGEQLAIYMDYNGDGDVDDLGDIVVERGDPIQVHTGQITIPDTAHLGLVRMRVVTGPYGSFFSGPCVADAVGEVRDYWVTIAPEEKGVSIASVQDVCAGSNAASNVVFTMPGIPAGTYFSVRTSLDGVHWTDHLDQFASSPATFNSTYPMGGLDSLDCFAQLVGDGYQSNVFMYRQYAPATTAYPAASARCGTGDLTAVLYLPSGCSVAWYAPGNPTPVNTGYSLTLLNQSQSVDFTARITNSKGCVSNYVQHFVVNQPATLRSVSPSTVMRGAPVHLAGTNLGQFTQVDLGSTTCAFTRVSNDSLDVIIPANATSGNFVLSGAGACGSPTGSVTVLLPQITLDPIPYSCQGDSITVSFTAANTGPATTYSLNLVINSSTLHTITGITKSPFKFKLDYDVQAFPGSVGFTARLVGASTQSNLVESFQNYHTTLNYSALPERCGPGEVSIHITKDGPGNVLWYRDGSPYYFAGGTDLYFNNLTANTTLKAVVTNGACSSMLEQAVKINPKPTITGTTPLNPVAGGVVTLSGSGFASVDSVHNNGNPLFFSSPSDNTLYVNVGQSFVNGRINVSTDKGCLDSSDVVTLTLPCQGVALGQVSARPASRYGCSDGFAFFEINRPGSSPAFVTLESYQEDSTWQVYNGQSQVVASDFFAFALLKAGDYRIRLYTGGCTDTAYFTINQPDDTYTIASEVHAPQGLGCEGQSVFYGNWATCQGGDTLIAEAYYDYPPYFTQWVTLKTVVTDADGNFRDSIGIPPGGAVYGVSGYRVRRQTVADDSYALPMDYLTPTCSQTVTLSGGSWSGASQYVRVRLPEWITCSSSNRTLEVYEVTSSTPLASFSYGAAAVTDSVLLPAGMYRFQLFAGNCAPNANFEVGPPPIQDQWPITFGDGGDDFVRGIVRDSAGNVYASISFQGTIDLQGTSITSINPNKRAAMLAKFDAHGQLIWYTQMGNATFNMEPQGVNVDGGGNPYWAGSFAGTVTFTGAPNKVLVGAGGYDAYTARFDPATGQCLWATKVGSTGGDYLYALFVSNSGNVYAGGSYGAAFNLSTTSGMASLPNAGGLDGFIVKMNSNGQVLYATRLGSTDNDEVKSIYYMGGDLVACGYMGNNTQFTGSTVSPQFVAVYPTLNGSRDAWVARINSQGLPIWVKNFGTIYNDEASSVTVDPSTGNVFAAAQVADAPMVFNGTSYRGYGNNDIAVLGFNFYTQEPVWASRVGSASGDAPTQIKWDGQRLVVSGYASGTVTLVPGTTMPGNGGQDGVILHYRNTDGLVTASSSIGGSGNDRVLAMEVDQATQQVFAAGRFASMVAFPDLANTAVPRTSNGGAYDGFICRYQPQAASSSARLGQPVESLLKAWPNPARDWLTVQTETRVELLTLEGKHVAFATPTQGQAVFRVSHLSPGIYLVRTTDGKVARIAKE